MSTSNTQVRIVALTEDDFCPKCGKEAQWQGPRYNRSFFVRSSEAWPREWLEHTCMVCGYIRRSATHDAPRLRDDEIFNPRWEQLGRFRYWLIRLLIGEERFQFLQRLDRKHYVDVSWAVGKGETRRYDLRGRHIFGWLR